MSEAPAGVESEPMYSSACLAGVDEVGKHLDSRHSTVIVESGILFQAEMVLG